MLNALILPEKKNLRSYYKNFHFQDFLLGTKVIKENIEKKFNISFNKK